MPSCFVSLETSMRRPTARQDLHAPQGGQLDERWIRRTSVEPGLAIRNPFIVWTPISKPAARRAGRGRAAESAPC
jgi:hypothetical protein